MAKALLKTMRPKQWTKNVFVFAALVFDKKMFNLEYFGRALAAFFLFCIVSGVVYVLNDIVDADKDRLHPKKKNRPIASGDLPASLAAPLAAGLLIVAVALSFLLSVKFGAIILIYFLINVA
jgi:4-hydroxybenzoate polyprenyltransferase